MNLSKNAKVSKIVSVTAGVAGTSDTITSSAIDMTGFDSVIIVAQLGAFSAGGTAALKVQDSSDNSTYADVEGTLQSFVAGDAEEVVLIDIANPRKRYMKLLNTRATANSAFSAIAIQYNSKLVPVASQGTGVNLETFYSPADGTA